MTTPSHADNVRAAAPVLDEAVKFVHARLLQDLERRLGPRFGTKLADAAGLDQQRVRRTISGKTSVELRDLLAWAMAAGLDLFDVLPRRDDELLPAQQLAELGSWRSGRMRPPVPGALDLANLAVRACQDTYTGLDERGASRLLTPAVILAALVTELLDVMVDPEVIDLPAPAAMVQVGQLALAVDGTVKGALYALDDAHPSDLASFRRDLYLTLLRAGAGAAVTRMALVRTSKRAIGALAGDHPSLAGAAGAVEVDAGQLEQVGLASAPTVAAELLWSSAPATDDTLCLLLRVK